MSTRSAAKSSARASAAVNVTRSMRESGKLMPLPARSFSPCGRGGHAYEHRVFVQRIDDTANLAVVEKDAVAHCHVGDQLGWLACDVGRGKQQAGLVVPGESEHIAAELDQLVAQLQPGWFAKVHREHPQRLKGRRVGRATRPSPCDEHSSSALPTRACQRVRSVPSRPAAPRSSVDRPRSIAQTHSWIKRSRCPSR
jgi:hypothetical protein